MAAAPALISPPLLLSAAPKRPDYFLPAAALVVASGCMVRDEPAPYDITLVLLFIAGIFLGRLAFHRSHRIPLILLSAFIAANFLPLPNTINWRIAIGYSSVTCYLAASSLFFAAFAGRYGYRGVSALMRAYVTAGFFSALLAISAYLRVIPFQSILLRYGRAQALFKDPNVYGPYLIPVLLYMLSLLLRARPLTKGFWIALAISVVTSIGIFLSFSRACWINSAVAILFFVTLQLLYGLRLRRIDRGLLRLAVLVTFVAAGTLAFIDGSGSRTASMLLDRLGHNGLHDYDAQRFDTQRKAFETFLGNPIGIGTRQSEFVFDYSTHNMYLRVLVENGLLGFSAFFAFIAASLFRSLRFAFAMPDVHWRNLFLVVSSCLAGLLVNGFVIDTIRWRHLWFLLGLAWCIPLYRRPEPPVCPNACRLSPHSRR